MNGRVNLDATIYDKITKNQIFNVAVSPATGFTSKNINAGAISNKGFELGFTAIPVQLKNGFEWSSTFNYGHNASKVKELYVAPTGDTVKTIVLGSAWYVNTEARLGEAYGSLFGYSFQRDSATGQLMVSDGLTVQGDRRILGNIQPKWLGGWSNTFSYKQWALSGLLDIKRGGDIYSITNWFGEYAGVLSSTMRGREVDWNNPGIVVQGVDKSTCGAGSHTVASGPSAGRYVCVGGQKNTTNVTSEAYFQNIFPVNEYGIYDGSYVKLREVRLSYDLRPSWAARLRSNAVNISLVGRNLAMWTKVPNIDPEFTYSSNSNLQGLEYAIVPNPRVFGFNLRITP